MSTIIKRLVSIGAVGFVALASACGTSDDGVNANSDRGADEATPNGGGGGAAGGGSAGAGNAAAATFPLYVQRLIETSTTDTAMPEPETAWGPLPDDEVYVIPAGFFQ